MKYSILIAIASLAIPLVLNSDAAAHSGRTNAQGCHNDRKNGGYHCHNSGSSGSDGSSTPTRPIQTQPQQPSLPTARVISVGDGDTVRVLLNGQNVTVRMACIDAPESAQKPWGQQSADRLKAFLPQGQIVSVRVADTDQYGRSVAEVYKNGTSVNLQMVQEGRAVVYRQFLNACQATQSQYLAVEAQAKQRRLGYWNQASPVMPWDFRRSQR